MERCSIADKSTARFTWSGKIKLRTNLIRSVRVLAVMRGFLSFAFLHAVMFSNLVGDYSSTGTHCASNECALTAAHQSTYDGSARR